MEIWAGRNAVTIDAPTDPNLMSTISILTFESESESLFEQQLSMYSRNQTLTLGNYGTGVQILSLVCQREWKRFTLHSNLLTSRLTVFVY